MSWYDELDSMWRKIKTVDNPPATWIETDSPDHESKSLYCPDCAGHKHGIVITDSSASFDSFQYCHACGVLLKCVVSGHGYLEEFEEIAEKEPLNIHAHEWAEFNLVMYGLIDYNTFNTCENHEITCRVIDVIGTLHGFRDVAIRAKQLFIAECVANRLRRSNH